MQGHLIPAFRSPACLLLIEVARIRWVCLRLERSGESMNHLVDAVRADLAWVAADFADIRRE